MVNDDMLKEMNEAVNNFDDDLCEQLATKAIEIGMDPVLALEEGFAKALRLIGEDFGKGEIFVTELIAAAQAVEAGAEVLNVEISRLGVSRETIGKVLIGTVMGDIHNIGKNIVSTMLHAAGFEIIDLGVDVPTHVFVEKVKEHKPNIVGLSSLLTTTMGKQKEVIDALIESGLRDSVKIIIGGAPVSKEWAKEIGADAYAFDASSAVEASLELMRNE
ncbi:MAG: cobalamin B12-binding domain-containing protein [Candidatus Thorarchaeota archaeon]